MILPTCTPVVTWKICQLHDWVTIVIVRLAQRSTTNGCAQPLCRRGVSTHVLLSSSATHADVHAETQVSLQPAILLECLTTSRALHECKPSNIMGHNWKTFYAGPKTLQTPTLQAAWPVGRQYCPNPSLHINASSPQGLAMYDDQQMCTHPKF